MKKSLKFIAASAFGASLFAPLCALAAVTAVPTGMNTTNITRYSADIINTINLVIVPVLMAIAFIVFLWGVYKYFIYGADNDTERATGRQIVLWGVIGFVIILSLWGLVNLVGVTFGLQFGGGSPTPPTFTVPSAAESQQQTQL